MSFDNVALRARLGHCVVATVRPPFQTAYWRDVGQVECQLGLPPITATGAGASAAEERFLCALADRALMDGRFRPAQIGFRSQPEEIVERLRQRERYRLVKFVGPCSKEVVFNGLEAAAGQVRGDGAVDVEFKRWDMLVGWRAAREQLDDVCHQLRGTRKLRGGVAFFSELRGLPVDLWAFLYERRLRLAWLATDLAGCRDMGELDDYRRNIGTWANLEKVGQAGLWLRIVMPVSAGNVGFLPDLVRGLLEASRGGTIELVPAPLLPLHIRLAPPTVADYVGALLAVYQEASIPLRLVSPLSWVAARIDSQTALPPSPATVGAELAVLPNGDLYPGESCIGMERWRLGNVLGSSAELRWERLDGVGELFTNSLRPAKCRACDWRYRCGGVDGGAALLEEKRRAQAATTAPQGAPGSQPADEPVSLFDLYCEPRRQLFEEMVWGSAEAASNGGVAARERLELRADGIDFRPSEAGQPEVHQ